jgi:hypothetical protein
MGTQVGQELLNVPFPKMIFDMAMAISKGQLALDKASTNLVKILANTTFDYVPEVTETLSPNPRQIQHGAVNVTVTGVQVDVDVADSFPMTLLQAGITPTFYQFVESIIEVKMSMSSHQEHSDSLDIGVDVSASGGFLFGSASVSSHVNYSSANKYSFDVNGSSLLRTTLKPVPPPARMMPRFILVNAMEPGKVTVTISET